VAKIAVINDDPDFIDFVCTVLQDEGYETATAHKGGETVELARRETPDVILMDIVMEAWDSGFNTVTHAQAQVRYGKYSVIICTARPPRH
jgi:CheY-like chemotaxis protein